MVHEIRLSQDRIEQEAKMMTRPPVTMQQNDTRGLEGMADDLNPRSHVPEIFLDPGPGIFVRSDVGALMLSRIEGGIEKGKIDGFFGKVRQNLKTVPEANFADGKGERVGDRINLMAGRRTPAHDELSSCWSRMELIRPERALIASRISRMSYSVI